MSIFTTKKVWKFLIKIQLTKSAKKNKEIKVSPLMPIRVKQGCGFFPTFIECQSLFTTCTYLELTSALFCSFDKTIDNLKIMMFDRQNKSIVYFYAIEGSCFFFTDMQRQLLHCILLMIKFALLLQAPRNGLKVCWDIHKWWA